MTSFEVRRKTGLHDEECLPLRAGTAVNPIHPGYRRVSVYYWKDIAQLCLRRGIDLP